MTKKTFNNLPRVGIIGGGFAGLAAASHLSASEFSVSLFDHKRKFDWLPNIHELISGMKQERDLQIPLKRRLRQLGHTFLNVSVRSINPERKKIRTSHGKTYQFDFLIVAPGGVNNTYGVKGADKYTLPFKSVKDCARIRDRLRKVSSGSNNSRIGIIGGGLEGVESLGELLRAYSTKDNFTITLVVGSPRLMMNAPEIVAKRLQNLCARYLVDLRLGCKVTEVHPRGVILDHKESLDLDAIIWTGGGKAPPLLFEAGLAEDKNSWAKVNEFLESMYFKNVFVIGDAAALPEPIDKQAFYALDMGELAARNIIRLTRGQPKLSFKPVRKPFLLTFGNIDTFMIYDEKVISGPSLCIAKELVYQLIMSRLEGVGSLRSQKDAIRRSSSLLRVFAKSNIIKRLFTSLLSVKS